MVVGKKVAILQSNYIPWKGYFDLVAACDEFIIYDDMQYTRRDWRNRNQIKTADGVRWLTVPVKVKGKFYQKIRDTEIDGDEWRDVHWKSIVSSYKKAPYFDSISRWLNPIYMENEYVLLSSLNRRLMESICAYLGITTKISNSWDYHLAEGKTERLVDLCVQAGATEYISGPSARDYIVPEQFSEAGIHLSWFNYDGYQEYGQLWGDFTHHVTILDLLLNCGTDAARYMRFVR